MQPQQTPQQNPYDFIMNSGPQPQPSSRLPLPGPPGSKKAKIIALVGGALGLIIILILVMSLFGGGDKSSSQQLLSIAQQQQEIIRVANLAEGKARGQVTINLSASTASAVSSSQGQIIGLIGKKAKTDAKTLGLKNDPKTDQALTAASQNNQFDEVFIKTLDGLLLTYQKDLKTAYDGTSNKKTKETLQTAYKSAGILLDRPKTDTF